MPPSRSQNYFRMYHKLAGMTGTAKTEEAEFQSIYGLDVMEIPTNKPLRRIDNNDIIYGTERGKFDAVVDEIVKVHATGQPILVGTISVEKSEMLSDMLSRRGIKHQVLNAKLHAKEAEIVAQAGSLGCVTIATNMAGAVRTYCWAAIRNSLQSGNSGKMVWTNCS